MSIPWEMQREIRDNYGFLWNVPPFEGPMLGTIISVDASAGTLEFTLEKMGWDPSQKFPPAPYPVHAVTVPTSAFGANIPPAPVALTLDPPAVGHACIVLFVDTGVNDGLQPYVIAFF